MKTFIALVVLILLALAAYVGYIFFGTGAQVAQLPTESKVYSLLDTATLDLSDIGGAVVTLADGEATFPLEVGQGFVSLAEPRAIVFKGDDADVFALYYINTGGTGTFAFLTQFEYVGATNQITEVERVLLGDRIAVDSILLSQTAPTSYDILVELRDRMPGEGMAAEPTVPLVLHFVRTAEGLAVADVIFGTVQEHNVVIQTPLPGQTVGTNFTVAGAARGPWFFEASLPIQIEDTQGNVIASVGAEAQDEWMTEDLVPFSAAVELPDDASGIYVVVVKKDNPSGLPEHDASVSYPIVVE